MVNKVGKAIIGKHVVFWQHVATGDSRDCHVASGVRVHVHSRDLRSNSVTERFNQSDNNLRCKFLTRCVTLTYPLQIRETNLQISHT